MEEAHKELFPFAVDFEIDDRVAGDGVVGRHFRAACKNPAPKSLFDLLRDIKRSLHIPAGEGET